MKATQKQGKYLRTSKKLLFAALKKAAYFIVRLSIRDEGTVHILRFKQKTQIHAV